MKEHRMYSGKLVHLTNPRKPFDQGRRDWPKIESPAGDIRQMHISVVHRKLAVLPTLMMLQSYRLELIPLRIKDNRASILSWDTESYIDGYDSKTMLINVDNRKILTGVINAKFRTDGLFRILNRR